MKNKRLLMLCATLALCLLLPLFAFADAGNFSGDSDWGGGSDWGGSSDWGSDWDSDSDWGSDSDWLWSGDWDSDNDDSSSSSFSSSSDSEGDAWFGWVMIAVVAVLVVKSMQMKATRVKKPAAKPVSSEKYRSLQSLHELDPNFSEDAIAEKVSNLYVQMQNNWQAKDFEPMRPYMTDRLFAQFDRQLDSLRQSRQTNRVERIAVLSALPVAWTQDAQNDTLLVMLNTRIVDYTVNDATGAVVSGSPTAEKFMEYEWTLVRRTGEEGFEALQDVE